MPSAFTGNIMEGKIAFPTSTLGLLVNRLGVVMPIRFSVIPESGDPYKQDIKHRFKIRRR